MKTKLLNESEERTWALVFDVGDPVMENLECFVREQELRGAHFSAIGCPTLEVILTEEPGHLVRRYDETTGLALIDL